MIRQFKLDVNHDWSARSIVYPAALALVCLMTQPALATKEQAKDSASSGADSHSAVTSDQFLELGVQGADSLRMEGEQAMKMGKVDRAIIVLQQAVELAPKDIDGRILYGEALEKKLLKQAAEERDPKLYNFVIKQWLYVAKSGQFADQSQQGFNHLYKLTGKVPKRFEKEKSFLERVLIPEDGTVPVVIGKHHQSGKTNPALPPAPAIAEKKENEQL